MYILHAGMWLKPDPEDTYTYGADQFNITYIIYTYMLPDSTIYVCICTLYDVNAYVHMQYSILYNIHSCICNGQTDPYSVHLLNCKPLSYMYICTYVYMYMYICMDIGQCSMDL